MRGYSFDDSGQARRRTDSLAPSFMGSMPGAGGFEASDESPQAQEGGFGASPFSAPPQGDAAPAGQPPMGGPPAAGVGGAVKAFGALRNVNKALSDMSTTTDPRQKAVLRDTAARTMAKTLQDAGHKVSFKGDQIIVDGRPYVLGDGNVGAGGGDLMGPNGPANGNTGIGGQGNRPDGRGASVGHDGVTASGMTREQYRDAWQGSGASSMADLRAFIAQHGGELLSDNGDVRTPFGEVINMGINARGSADGRGPMVAGWGATGADAAAVDAAAGGGGFGFASSAPWSSSVVPQAMSRTASLQSSLEDRIGALPGRAGEAPAWASNAQPYAFDGDLGLEALPDVSGMEDDLGAYSFGGFSGLPDLGDAALDPETEALMREILSNPESLDDATLGKLKARSKDVLAERAAIEDADLVAQGTELGIDDSRWLASERNAGKRDRDRAILDADTDLEVEAATVNNADRRAAAGLGAAYAEGRAGRTRADRGQLAGEQATAESFKAEAASSRQRAVSTAADTKLRAAALAGDRASLRENLKAEAARQGLSQDEMTLRYTTSLMDDLTRRHGIDVSAHLDLVKLEQAGREFHEELAMRLAELQQRDEQFGASYGLQTRALDLEENRQSFDQYKWLYE